MKKLNFICLVLFASLVGMSSAHAAVRSWEIDKAHTNFYFSIDHIYSKIRGHFNEYSGEIQFDPDNLAESKLFFKIETASIDTNIAKRDKHLMSADFFDSDKFPQMTFESKKITAAGNGVYDVLGKFTVKGVEYELLLPLTFGAAKEHPAVKGKEVIGFNGTVMIDRLAYKVGDGKLYKLGVVGKDVEIVVTIEALAGK